MAKDSQSSVKRGTWGQIKEGKINHGGLKPPSTTPRPTVAPQGKPGTEKSK